MAIGSAGATTQLVLRWLFALALVALTACGGGGSTADIASLSSADTVSADSQAARRISGPGLTGEPPTVVNTTTAGDQTVQAIGALADGGYAVVWLSNTVNGTSTTSSLYLQRYDSLGARQGPETPIQFDLASGTQTAVAVLGDGGVVVAYRTATQSFGSVPAEITLVNTQRFDANGAAAGPYVVVTSVYRQLFGAMIYQTVDNPRVIGWDDGSYLVSWSLTEHQGVYGTWVQVGSQRYDSQNQPVGPRSLRAPQPESADYEFIKIDQGGYIYTASFPYFGGAQRRYFFPGGTIPPIDGNEFGAVWSSALVGLANGGYAMVYWSSTGDYRLGSAGESGTPILYRQIFDSAGVPVGAPIAIAGPASTTTRPRAAALSDGGLVAFWTSSSTGELTAQRFNAAGAAVGDAFQLATGSTLPLAASLADGGLALAWTASGTAGDLDVVTQRLEPSDFGGKPGLARLRACQAEAKGLTGIERKQFMKVCLGK